MRNTSRSGNTVVMRLSTNDETADARNNIFFNTAAGTSLAMLAEAGQLTLANNWAKTGWRNSHEGRGFTGTVTGGGTMVTGTSPGFADAAAQNFRPAAGSPVIDAGTALHPQAAAVTRQYVKHQTSEPRPASGPLDLGAFEAAPAAAPVQVGTTTLPNARRTRYYDRTLQATGGSGTFVWAVTAGQLPPGVRLDPATGRLTGKARRRGIYSFTVRAADAQNAASSATRGLTVTTW